ncbi:hypothetical protein BpHYR1_032990 [Brachionus plicatilis]|uniref:Uncharacterized protein n=1 Tax=Brachionus plicatilis TaxID=10195 RepID=A0A3M7REW4_BRAPC|nr:hypothetical protein BpHYR1_032990 [Brachionus plicatilis]
MLLNQNLTFDLLSMQIFNGIYLQKSCKTTSRLGYRFYANSLLTILFKKELTIYSMHSSNFLVYNSFNSFTLGTKFLSSALCSSFPRICQIDNLCCIFILPLKENRHLINYQFSGHNKCDVAKYRCFN